MKGSDILTSDKGKKPGEGWLKKKVAENEGSPNPCKV